MAERNLPVIIRYLRLHGNNKRTDNWRKYIRYERETTVFTYEIRAMVYSGMKLFDGENQVNNDCKNLPFSVSRYKSQI